MGKTKPQNKRGTHNKSTPKAPRHLKKAIKKTVPTKAAAALHAETAVNVTASPAAVTPDETHKAAKVGNKARPAKTAHQKGGSKGTPKHGRKGGAHAKGGAKKVNKK